MANTNHYGAGVKASILILRKLPLKTTLKIKEQQKKYLTSAVKTYEKQITALEKRKANIENEHEVVIKILQWKKHQAEVIEKSQKFNDKAYIKKELDQLAKEASKKIKQITDTLEFKDWKKAPETQINDEIKALYELIYEKAAEDYKQYETEHNYQIFMAIAELIGYDATGRPTPQNDLAELIPELTRFLKHQIENPNGFFSLALQ